MYLTTFPFESVNVMHTFFQDLPESVISPPQLSADHWIIFFYIGQFRGDGRTVRTLVFGVCKICCITGSYLWVIQKDITL